MYAALQIQLSKTLAGKICTVILEKRWLSANHNNSRCHKAWFSCSIWHKRTLWCVEKYLRIELVGFLVYMYQQSWFLLPKQWPAQSKQLLQ